MTITMTSKNQITLPKKIVDALRLSKGALFDITVKSDHIELVPLEVAKREFSDAEYEKLEQLYKQEKGSAKKLTKSYINKIK